MRALFAVFRRELGSYFSTPIAYVFIVIFLALSATMAFYLGGFYENRQANLSAFFLYHPWLYLFLVPAISMRLWAEERKSGSLELLLTLPLTTSQAVAGKFLAAWAFTTVAVALTFPIWITVNYLGEPDNGVIAAAYLGSILMAGGFLAIGSCISATTRNQVIAFIISVVACFLFLVSDLPLVLEPLRAWVPQIMVDTIASLSFIQHFRLFSRGVINLNDVVYFALMIGFWLGVNSIVIEMKKSG